MTKKRFTKLILSKSGMIKYARMCAKIALVLKPTYAEAYEFINSYNPS